MRKLGFFAALIALLFSGCQLWLRYDSTITNESSRAVTFRAQGTDLKTIQPGESATVRNYIGARMDYYESSPARRVGFVQTGARSGKFIDLQSMPVRIENTRLFAVTLSAGGYMGLDPVTIGASTATTTGEIFTAAPVFTVDDENFPVTVDLRIVGGAMYVTIR